MNSDFGQVISAQFKTYLITKNGCGSTKRVPWEFLRNLMVSFSRFLSYGLVGEDWCKKWIEIYFPMKHLQKKTYTKILQPGAGFQPSTVLQP